MKKIAFICNYFPSLSETFIYREVLGLRERGVPLTLFSIRNPREYISKESLGLRQSTTYLLPIKLPSLFKSHFYFFFTKPLRYLYTLFFLLTRKYDHKIKDRKRSSYHFVEGVLLARLILQERDIHHIHAHYASQSASLAVVASSLTGIPFSFTAHAHDIWSDRLFIKDKVKLARFVITCSEYGKRVLIEDNNIRGKMAEKITNIYHGIDTEAFPQIDRRSKGGKITILNVGRLFERKGHKHLIQACKILKEDGHDLRCNIIGDGPALDRLSRLIEELKLTDTISLIGKVTQEEIKQYYQNSDIFVLPSDSENLPNVLLESMSTGVPVIATKIAGIPELVIHRKTGLLISPNNVEEIVHSIKLLLQDKTLYEILSKNGRIHVSENFDFRKSIEKIKNTYQAYDLF